MPEEGVFRSFHFVQDRSSFVHGPTGPTDTSLSGINGIHRAHLKFDVIG